MNTFLYTFAIAALLGLPSAAIAGVGNGNGADKGNKNGWTSVDHHNDVTISVPKGLVVSGENGRVDNGGATAANTRGITRQITVAKMLPATRIPTEKPALLRWRVRSGKVRSSRASQIPE